MKNNDIGILRLRGLPFKCQNIEVQNFFDGFEIINNGIKMLN